VSHRIRQDIGSYISLAADGAGFGDAHHAVVKAGGLGVHPHTGGPGIRLTAPASTVARKLV